VTDPRLAFAVALELAFACPGADAWKRAEVGGVRGVTVGPIENGYHPGLGYGSPAYDRALTEARSMGANWISVTPFGRVADLSGVGVDLTFEAPFERNRRDVARAVEMAHGRGLHVLIVPPLWVESGKWRGLIDPGSDEAWERWAQSYERYVLTWAQVAEATHTEMFSVGVELRSWVTTSRSQSFVRIIRAIRHVYHGLLTYSANWDDVENTVILGALDVIGINAFYPLSEARGAPETALVLGGGKVREKVHVLAERWGKPVLFTEMGYTTRTDAAVRPWEWPEDLSGVTEDQTAQAVAYRALVGPLLEEPDFIGFFVWRTYADPDDVSQEPGWGFSPRGKLAELVVRDAFGAWWATDPWWRKGWREGATIPGVYP
jgi:hypothetical protein